ncbi:hypothetical protein [Nannocystis bainbridge]|uniref:Uncharacterized protein n=1 Tax=Nannocystis bainbridge TaxID=2995303 RepID=A0ABT5DT89_9BACT|nr:hypothetical protein [Nannocystis bainbridge]MDC0716860.1 hypothetical protein [Nannocystis bainbridge]
MVFKVGGDIDAYCTKCRLDTIHVVVALKADNAGPKRVECKSCGGQHMYHAPKLPSRSEAPSQPAVVNRSAAARNPAPPKPPKAPKAAKAAAKAAALSPPAGASTRDWLRRMEDLALQGGTPIKAYSMRETFAAGDPVSHPKFGKGVVLEVLEAKKCAILFEEGRKVLAMGNV